MYLLRRHFGIGYSEWRDVLPAWYVDLLLDGLADEQQPPPDVLPALAPAGVLPDTLSEWK